MKKMGRPTEAKKDICVKVRIDEETCKKLELCMEVENLNKSEIIRQSIIKRYNELMNGEKKWDS